MDQTSNSSHLRGLPDPVTEAEFYADVPSKRLIAWLIDIAVISLITAGLTVLSLFTISAF